MKKITCRIILLSIILISTTFGCSSETKNSRNLTTTPSVKINENKSENLSNSVSVQTNRPQYNDGERLILVVSNITSKDIRIPNPRDARIGEGTFRFYKRSAMGWKRLYPFPGYLAPQIANVAELVIPVDHEAEFDITHIMGSYTEYPVMPKHLAGEFVVQIRYEQNHSTNGDELVQYSNMFLIREIGSITETKINIGLISPQSLMFDLQNNSSSPLWLPSPCSSSPVIYEGQVFSDDGYLSLQRLTDEGAWQIIRFAKANCEGMDEPVRIDPGHTTVINAVQWFQKRVDELAPGIYRWDVVFYLEEKNDRAGVIVLKDAHHVFSEVFEYGQR